ncbi:MAG: hypothetical protein QOC99_1145 [Acidobacteriota bacterium]|jgi:hypothetical protein|nr:hypothetical protein [Acidobacteriota bacterium]
MHAEQRSHTGEALTREKLPDTGARVCVHSVKNGKRYLSILYVD